MHIDDHSDYFQKIYLEHHKWCIEMERNPSLANSATAGVQQKINKVVPDKVHQVITRAIKEIVRGVLYGAEFTTGHSLYNYDLQEAENIAERKIKFYASSSAAEGAITGYGGFISGLADFPLWLSLKMKMLFELAETYGFNVSDYKERLYILYVFQLTFSSQKRRQELFEIMKDWDKQIDQLPSDINEFDWRTFQLEYRDFIDVAKLLQLIPGIGAIAGAYVNHKYTKRLGKNAMNSYRLRMNSFKMHVD